MTTSSISAVAEAAREHARSTDGRFGAQEHSAPELSLGGTPVITATGEPTTVAFLHNGSDYEGVSLATARDRLGIPASEPDDLVIATIALMGEGSDYPHYTSQEPRYADPGDEGVLDTSEWTPLGDGVEWAPYADTWLDEANGKAFVRSKAVFDASEHGFDGKLTAFEGIIARHAATDLSWVMNGDELDASQGKVYLPLSDHFAPKDFEPRIVQDRLLRQFDDVDPRGALAAVKEKGVVLTDEAIRASRDINGRAVGYAALAGRVPSDSEIFAVCRDFGVKCTLTDGYLSGETQTWDIADEHRDAVTKALNAWYLVRAGKEAA